MAKIILPPDLEWYDELGGEATGWVAEVDGPGWWHVSELDLSDLNPNWPTLEERDGMSEAKKETQWWLVEIREHGLPTLKDGPHSDRSGVEDAMGRD